LSKKISFSGSALNSYAQALFELAEESNSTTEIEKQISALMNLVLQSEDFNSFIKNPINKSEDLNNVLNKISNKFNFNQLLKRFLNFLVLKRRLFYLEKILGDFLNICSNKRGEITAKLTAAKELNNKEIEKIKSELTQNFGKNIKLDYKYDKSLIGGLIIQVGSIMVDTSLKNKLKQIENRMLEK
tara:strand:+ start:134 stop:691 length:558 start_codon:yes stop_codon:yes gene_type:complete